MSIFETDTIGAYELFFMLAVAAGLAIAWVSGRRSGNLGPEFPALLGLSLTAGIVGARTLHFDPGALPGAKTILGGVLLGSIALFAGRRFLRLHSGSTDALAVALPVGLAIGRVGCLLVGCCFGHPTDLPWGVIYDEHSAAFRAQFAAGLLPPDAATSLPVHATQIYEALLALLVAAAVPRLRRVVRQGGRLILAVLLLLTVGRILLEFLRARDIASVQGLTGVQWLLAGMALAVGLLLLLRERAGVNEGVPQLSSHASGMRVACVAAIPLVLLIASGSTFALIERIALASAALPTLLILAKRLPLLGSRRSGLPWERPSVSLALVAIVLQQPGGELSQRPEGDPRYPITSWSTGVSYAELNDREMRVVGREWVEGCGAGGYQNIMEEFRLHYRLVGYSVARTKRSGADRATTIRLIGLTGRETAADAAGRTTATDLGAIGAVVSFDWGNAAASGGTALGRFADDSRGRAIWGVRIGSATGIHARLGRNDVEPQGGRRPVTRASAGYTSGASGWAIRGGYELELERPFLGATLPVRNLLIEPTAVLPGGNSPFENKTELRITATYQFPARPPAQ